MNNAYAVATDSIGAIDQIITLAILTNRLLLFSEIKSLYLTYSYLVEYLIGFTLYSYPRKQIFATLFGHMTIRFIQGRESELVAFLDHLYEISRY
jgi:hypothetical protein